MKHLVCKYCGKAYRFDEPTMHGCPGVLRAMRSDAATEIERERARIVAWLRAEHARCSDSRHFAPKWAPSTASVVAGLTDAIERGEG